MAINKIEHGEWFGATEWAKAFGTNYAIISTLGLPSTKSRFNLEISCGEIFSKAMITLIARSPSPGPISTKVIGLSILIL